MAARYPELLLLEGNVSLELQPSWLLDKYLWALQLWGLLRKGSTSSGFWGTEPLHQVLSLARLQQLKRLWNHSETIITCFQSVLSPQWVIYWARMGSNTIYRDVLLKNIS